MTENASDDDEGEMRDPWPRRVLRLAAAAILGATLSGCATLPQLDTQQPDNTPESPAVMQNAGLATEVESLLAYIWEGDWELPPSGNVRTSCDLTSGEDSYLFYGSWTTSKLAPAPADHQSAESAIAELETWLETRGWSDLEQYEFSTEDVGVNALGISGMNSEYGVYELQATYYYEGELETSYPMVVVDIDSDCLVADK